MAAFEFDPFSKETFADPFSAFAELRKQCPVYHYKKDGHDFYILSRASDIHDAGRDFKVWSNRFGSVEHDLPENVAFNSDPPQHTEFRQVFASELTPLAVAKHAKLIESFAHNLIDEMLKKSEGDFHDDFAFPLPAMMITAVLDAPLEDYRLFKRWADDYLSETFNDSSPSAGQGVMREMTAYATALTQKYRDKLAAAGIAQASEEHIGTVLPDSLPARFMAARYQGRPWTQDEINKVICALVAGGHETTTSLLTNVVWRLLEVPERWALLKQNPELINAAIEESLRFDPPVLGMFRTSLCPTKLHDVEVPEHAKLMQLYGSGCRDEAVFENATEFRLDRPADEGRRHMAFGTGKHVCPGGPLARLVVRTALQALLDRLPNLRLLGAGERNPVYNFWGRKKLPMAWS
jgi:cytochrome P450